MSTATAVVADHSQLLSTDHWNGPGPWWPLIPLLWIAFVAAIVTTCLLLGRRHRANAGPRAGEARLAERFASGEIDEQEYRARRAVLKEQTR
jgi:putative membrane protein